MACSAGKTPMTAAGDDQRCRDHRDAGALRRRNAMRRARIRLCQRMPQHHRPDRPGDDRPTAARPARRQRSDRHAIRNWSFVSDARIIRELRSGLAPWAAFSGLKIHTSPPNMPTRNDTAPNSSDTLTPSLVINPAYPKASPMVASRTPQPAIEIGSIVISITGGTSWKTWPNITGPRSIAPRTRR